MLQEFLNRIVPEAVGSLSPLAFVIVFIGGVLTSISPCILSMIPIIVGYIGGYGEKEPGSRFRGFLMSLSFVLGLSVTFALFGAAAVMLGKVFGQVGDAWYYFLAALAIIMGLQLLGVFTINFPTLKKMPFKKGGFFTSFVIGLIFGLVASPCATPVLAVIIAYVASTGNFYYGSGLLFTYGLGHGLPLIAAGTFTAAIAGIPGFQKYSHYVTRGSGVILILFGLYFLALARWY